MGDDAQGTESTATTPTEGMASPATAQEGGAEAAAPTEAAAPAATTEGDIWAKVLELDPDEIIRRHNRLQGKVGSLAQQQVQKFKSDWERQQAADLAERTRANERAELRRLAEENPDALAARVITDTAKAEIAERERSQVAQAIDREHQKLASELNKVYERPIVKEIWEQADEATRAKMNWTAYDDIPSFMEAVTEIISDYRADKKAAGRAEELAKQRLEALKKEANIETVKADAETVKADLNLDGLSSGTRIFTAAEIKAMPLDEYRKHQTAIMAQYRAGYIK